MNRHERKIIHMALQDSRKVSTYSAGDEPRRYVVIVPRRRRRAEGSQRGRESCERAFSFWEQALFDVFDGVFDKD